MLISFLLAFLLLLSVPVVALENTGIRSGTALPSTCTPGDAYILTSGTVGMHVCSGTDTWTAPATAASIPAGLITFVVTGTCPTGWTEVAALEGKTLVGTVAANADVGTTGGADAITPAGTLSAQTFTGDVLAGHAHGTGTYAASAHAGTAVEDHASHTHTYTQTINHIHALSTILRSATTGGATTQVARTSDTSSTGDTALKTDNPDGGVATGTTAGPSATLTHSVTQPNTHTLSGSSESLTAGTPSGTVSQATFTGTGFDNRSAYVKAIFCSKD